MALHINLFGGPGSGKSRNRSRIFYKLKDKNYKVEEIVEYAKELTYEKNFIQLSDQVLLLGKQHHFHSVLNKEVDYIITDSPFIMGMLYIKKELIYKKELEDLALKMFNLYNNLNIFIERTNKYQEYGRTQTESQAKDKDKEIKEFLIKNNIPFITLKSGNEISNYIIDYINDN